MNAKKWPTVKILDVKVDLATLKQAVEWAEEQVNYNKVGQITTPNPEQVVLAHRDSEFKSILNSSGLSICDGTGLLWAARHGDGRNVGASRGSPENTGGARPAPTIYKRLSGVDLMLALCQKAAEKGWRVMFIGGKPGIAAAAASNVAIEQCSNLTIKVSSGCPDISRESSQEREKTIKEINKFRPQLLFVAYGAPWQEKWISRSLPRLKVNVAMGVGGAFDYLSGKVSRAPKLVRGWGLEWVWRLLRQPWRIKRQLGLVKFIWLVLKSKI